MNKILQIVELVLLAMERAPGKYTMEITSYQLQVTDSKKLKSGVLSSITPTVYTYIPDPKTSYQDWCNEMFGYFLKEIEGSGLLEKGIITQKEYESGEITLNTARQRFGLDPIEDGHKLVTLRTEDEVS